MIPGRFFICLCKPNCSFVNVQDPVAERGGDQGIAPGGTCKVAAKSQLQIAAV